MNPPEGVHLFTQRVTVVRQPGGCGAPIAVAGHRLRPGRWCRRRIDRCTAVILGRRAATLFDEKVTTSGPIDLRWEASPSGLRLPSGTYVIRARSDEHTVERLVTIVR